VEGPEVLDVVYILLTLVFFGLMIAYVYGCEALGHDVTSEESQP
jgi:hypothetical protein